VTAVLGPTNTGKTHLAIERMLGHESGIIGLPLRLLAREVYARVAARAGAEQVALVTGEEKIVPAQPRYWVSTVEAMPRETDAAFVAIDEVQLAADLERGHVFTDRILHLRGSQETLLLGAGTMRGIIEQLLPGVHVVTRPRMSVLAYAGQKKLTRLPERSAIVAFSADEVYGVAELIRRQRGGAAVVLGALSPRTRNKQVEIYQAGDVDFLVATDAIGMGLNLDLDHVAFAANRKYDGYQFRELSAAELGQIAGRAGRHMRDGTFGVTGRTEPFPDALVEAVETHRFEPVKTMQWRNDELDFSSTAALKASLDEPASVEGLTKAPPADDQTALEALSRDEDIADKARRPEQVKRLWEVCRLPDYRKIAPAQHAQLIGEIFGFIVDGGTLPDDWIASQIKYANRTDGDIDTLSSRIAHIRTWTFVANQPDWLSDPSRWREESKAVEDALSDALHESLTKRFVDRRTSVLMRRLREKTMLEAEITPAGEVLVEGHHVGALSGFRFTPDTGGEGAEAQALRNAAQKALATAIVERAEQLARAGDGEIVLSSDAYLRWRGEPVARLIASEDVLKPRLVILADEQLSGPARDMVERRLNSWVTSHIATVLKPLVDLAADQSLAGMARGIAFRLVESLGILERRDVAEDVRGLDQDARAGLRRVGVRFGAHHVYMPALLKPAPSTLIAQLWALKHKDMDVPGLAEMPAISASGRTSVTVDPAFDSEVYRRFGFRVYGRRAVRIDILERLADLIRPALSWQLGSAGERPPGALPGGRGFTVTPGMTSLLGASGEDMAVILKGLGYRMDRVPKPVEPPPQALQAQAAGSPELAAATELELAGDASGDPPGEPAPEQAPAEEPPVQEPTIDPPADDPPSEAPPLEDPQQDDPPLQEPPVEIPTIGDPQVGTGDPVAESAGELEGHAEPVATLSDSNSDNVAADANAFAAGPTLTAGEPVGSATAPAEATDTGPAEPEMIEVWRPSFGRPRRGEAGRNRPEGAQTRGRHRRDRPEGQRRFGGPGPGQPADQGGPAPANHDPARPDQRGPRRDRTQAADGHRRHSRTDRPERPHGPDRPGRHDRQNRPDQATRPQTAQRPPRDRPVDPDSPFAALAALRKDLEKSGRE
jgi:ATP-dependent RNA helicase SUPV3L1/SUV3